jgi:hypothetical protein
VLRIEVDDPSTAPPSLRHAPPPSEDGRGVFLVDALADAWGAQTTDGGKTVWFELEIPRAVVPAPRG